MKATLKNQGFTLIEVVIALGVLGFGILTMFSMQAFGIKGNAIASKITQEVAWSVSGLEQILDMEYDDVAKSNKVPDLSADVKDSLYTVTWGVAPNQPITGLMTVKVNIASKVDGKNVELEFVRADENAL